MKAVKKYKITNLTTGKETICSRMEFAISDPEIFRLMDEMGIAMVERNVDPDKTGFRYEEYTQELPTCQRCGAVAIVEVCGKTSDGCNMRHLHREYDGYVLRGMGIDKGDEDYLEFEFCTNCGQIQNTFPRRIHGAIVTKETKGYKEGYYIGKA